MSPSNPESAVTPIVGTVIVLAITVAGIATALFMGTPVLTRLRERAALENVVGQLEEVRAAANDMYVPDESRYPTVSIPAGHLSLGDGSHLLVTVDQDIAGTTYDNCDFRVKDWSDWTTANANKVTVTATGCPTIAGINNATTGTHCNGAALALATGACFEAYRVNGTAPTSWPVCTASTTASCYLTWTASGATYTLSFPMSGSADYLFRLTNSTSTVYAQAWLMHMDRIAWNTGGVHANYEGGGIFAQEGNGFFLASSPLVSEEPLGGAYFLRIPTLQGSEHGAFTGSGSHSVGLILKSGHVRVDMVQATLVRIDFHGDLAEPWCNAFLLRDVLASLDGDYYKDVGAAVAQGGDNDPPHACSGTASPDAIRSVKYDEPAAFRVTLTQTILHGSLLL